MPNFDGKNAQEACQYISSEAERIKAEGDKVSKIIKSVLPTGQFLDPSNYYASNNAVQEIRNITGLDLSNNDLTTLKSVCDNFSSTVQSNTITGCSGSDWAKILDTKYCASNPDRCVMPSIHDITQANSSASHQSCALNGLVDIAKQRKLTVDSAALVEASQKATNLASNTSSQRTCNVVSTDMSTQEYLDILNQCSAKKDVSQTNELTGCQPMYNIAQKNLSDNFDECVQTNNYTKDTKDDATVKLSSIQQLKQVAEGLNPFLASGSSCICCIILLVCAYYFMYSE